MCLFIGLVLCSSFKVPLLNKRTLNCLKANLPKRLITHTWGFAIISPWRPNPICKKVTGIDEGTAQGDVFPNYQFPKRSYFILLSRRVDDGEITLKETTAS